ncbi:hypothetical protein MKEN_01259400 [Mycena kentingensis (nom. inval.)]|nr:hypothetical protein MKEN_01259400 [Mycena kentingensis (nom. inval.)]
MVFHPTEDFDIENIPSSSIRGSSPVYEPDPENLETFPDNGIPFADIPMNLVPDGDDDPDYQPTLPSMRAPRSTDAERCLDVLQYMRQRHNRNFSLRSFLLALASDDPEISTATAHFFSSASGPTDVVAAIAKRTQNAGLRRWIVQSAADICSEEVESITTRASSHREYDRIKSLRIPPQSVTVELTENFSLRQLGATYDCLTPNTQMILRAVIGKYTEPETLVGDIDMVDGEDDTLDDEESDVARGTKEKRRSRNPDWGRIMATSILLNLRSRTLNYHQVVTSLTFWDQRVPKRLVQLMNHYGIAVSPSSQMQGVSHLSKDSSSRARIRASDPNELKILPYDNFNWRKRTWETSTASRSIQYDEVSALLVLPYIPPELRQHTAALADIDRFESTIRRRHEIPRGQSLQEILPNAADRISFRTNSILHIATVLCEEIATHAPLLKNLDDFQDADAIPHHRTEVHYLVPFNQEQGSTRGNMIVLTHYFLKVLNIPKPVFQRIMHFVLGDRLTTVRDRKAQGQRAVDRSEYRIDNFSCLRMLNGMMHFSLNWIENSAKNFMRGAGSATDLQTLLNLPGLENYKEQVNVRKIDFYAWLRFLDSVLRALILRAYLCARGVDDPQLIHAKAAPAKHELMQFAADVFDQYLIQSPDALLADDKTTGSGVTNTSQAVLLFFHLMTLREMRHSIRLGHPRRMLTMVKFWTPMFYAGGSFNYANESMELLHNMIHDWPADSARVLLASMLACSGKPGAVFLEMDMRVEHHNDRIKEHVKGPNASPAYLERITPALGPAHELTDELYEEMGIQSQTQRHAHVKQHKTVEIIVTHLSREHIFDFGQDREIENGAQDLYHAGLRKLAGPGGGHEKHLTRHLRELRSRPAQDEETLRLELEAEKELILDAERPKTSYTLQEGLDEDAELDRTLRSALGLEADSEGRASRDVVDYELDEMN